MPEQERHAGMEIEDIDEGDKVQWNYGAKGHPSGVVSEIVADKLTITSKGKQISKNGDEENPAVHVERQGNDVVKRAAELHVLRKGDGEAPEMTEGKENGVVGEETKDELSEKSHQKKEASENGKAEDLEAQQEEGNKNNTMDEEDKDLDMKEVGEKTIEEQHKENGKGGGEVNEAVKLHQEANSPRETSQSAIEKNAKTKKKQDGDEEKDKGQENGENGKKRKAEEAAEDTADKEGGEAKKAKTEDGQTSNEKPRGRGRPAKGDKPETKNTTKKKEPTVPTRRSTRNKS